MFLEFKKHNDSFFIFKYVGNTARIRNALYMCVHHTHVRKSQNHRPPKHWQLSLVSCERDSRMCFDRGDALITNTSMDLDMLLFSLRECRVCCLAPTISAYHANRISQQWLKIYEKLMPMSRRNNTCLSIWQYIYIYVLYYVVYSSECLTVACRSTQKLQCVCVIYVYKL